MPGTGSGSGSLGTPWDRIEQGMGTGILLRKIQNSLTAVLEKTQETVGMNKEEGIKEDKDDTKINK